MTGPYQAASQLAGEAVPILGVLLLCVVGLFCSAEVMRGNHGRVLPFFLLALAPAWFILDPAGATGLLKGTVNAIGGPGASGRGTHILDAIASAWQPIVASLVGLGAILMAYRPGSVPPRRTLVELEAQTRAMERAIGDDNPTLTLEERKAKDAERELKEETLNDQPERTYALTKVAAGDYLLPSNDGKEIFRLIAYEDGPSAGLDIPRDRTFWSVRRWRDGGAYVDTGDDAWYRWELVSDTHDTRADAIREALR